MLSNGIVGGERWSQGSDSEMQGVEDLGSDDCTQGEMNAFHKVNCFPSHCAVIKLNATDPVRVVCRIINFVLHIVYIVL